MGIRDLEEYKISKIELKTFEKLPNYTFINSSYNVITSFLPEIEIEKVGVKLILSNQITSALMWYDTELDSLHIKSFSSQLTADKKVKNYQLEHETDESFDVEYRRFHQEINFLPPFWDEKNQVFYRFSYQENEGKTMVYLTAYDEKLNQIGETVVPKLTKRPAKHFTKDGKIWIYENMDDELAFVRLSFTESK